MQKSLLTGLSNYFEGYTKHVNEENLLVALVMQKEEIATFFKLIPTNKELYKYAEGKWTIKEILQHIIDTERVFSYRSLCFSRKEKQDLSSFDENDYVTFSNANYREMSELIHEFDIVRQGTIMLYKSFTKEQLLIAGMASQKEATPLLYGFTIVGHCTHHQKIIQQLYL